VPWEGEFHAALVAARRGTWRAAAESLVSLSEKVRGQPAIVRNIAVLLGWLGREQEAAQMWHRYACIPDVPLDDAVAAEALAQYLDENNEDVVQQLRFTHRINDMDRLMERLLSDRRVVPFPVDPRELVEEGQPPARGVFMLLDRPATDASPETPWRDLPRVLGLISAYGRETDREARLEVSLDRVPDLEARQAAVAEIVGEWADPSGKEEVRGQVPLVEWLAAPRLHLPEGTSTAQAATVFREYRREALLKGWAETPLTVLDGKRPREVAADPAYRVRLQASLLVLELVNDNVAEADHYRALRDELGLPQLESPDPAGLDIASPGIGIGRLARLDAARLSDPQLLTALQRSVMKNLSAAMYRFGVEALSRSSTQKQLELDSVYQVVVRSSPDSATTLHWIEQARRSAEARKVSPARWLLTELSARIGRGEAAEARRILETLYARHAKEPGVADAVKRILESYGLLDQAPPAEQRPAPAEAAPPPEAEPKRIWTPDQANAPSPSAAGQSKLWIPGRD